MKFSIRDIKHSELAFLKEMLYQAIFVPEGEPPLTKEIIEHPDLAKYIEGFGRDGDLCLVAKLNGKLVGAALARLFSEQDKGYGFVDSQTPELSMAVLEGYRNIGIGSKLLTGVLNELKNKGYRKASLSVDKSNSALNLYLKFGFKILSSTATSVTMIKSF